MGEELALGALEEIASGTMPLRSVCNYAQQAVELVISRRHGKETKGGPPSTFRPCAVHLAPARAHLAAQLAALDLYLADSTPAHFATWVATTDAAELWAASTARSCASCRTGGKP